jgi:hypothetical protein
VKQIHQRRLATADATIKVNAPWSSLVVRQRHGRLGTPRPRLLLLLLLLLLWTRHQGGVQCLQRVHGGSLRGVPAAERAGSHERVEARARATTVLRRSGIVGAAARATTAQRAAAPR